ncbi:MAG TPA: hypothetical protein VED40_12875 [Azospirillaceae bacterium]|nr:hypothetical protein [Azospirillaceae bacterium]
MIREFLSSALTTCPAPARRLGYADEVAAIQARARRCRAAWEPHLAATRTAILDAATGLRRRRTVLVLGSGALLDVPLAGLAESFQRVLLADIAHPPAARRAARLFPNVEFATLDLTGTVEDAAAGRLPEARPSDAFLAEPMLDLVVSANLASQLPLRPVAALKDAAARPDFGRAIVERHLEHLARFPCRTLLVTDVERVFEAPDGGVLRTEDPLFGARPPASLMALPLAAPLREWDWLLAPRGEASRKFAIRTRVQATLRDPA